MLSQGPPASPGSFALAAVAVSIVKNPHSGYSHVKEDGQPWRGCPLNPVVPGVPVGEAFQIFLYRINPKSGGNPPGHPHRTKPGAGRRT